MGIGFLTERQAPDILDGTLAKKDFLASHIFHERHMNSCPSGCEGCAVSAKTSGKGAINFFELKDFYSEASKLGVDLKITKVEGYDPVFVSYPDAPETPFAETVKLAVDLGHTIITPVCTTGSWKSKRTIWQLEELGKLSNKYREYRYPSGNTGTGFVLSVPRDINPFANKYDFDEHIKKVSHDIELLAVGGVVDVLIYFNSNKEGDEDIAVQIKNSIKEKLSKDTLLNAKLIVTDFNAETLPESCFRYDNSLLYTDEGFQKIDPITMEWTEKTFSPELN